MAEIARQHWSAERYAETAHFVPALGTKVLELLAPSPASASSIVAAVTAC
jgi:hypothetical protein